MVSIESIGPELPPDRFQEFVDRYISSVQVPDRKTKNPFILATAGLIGSGKSTVIKPLAKKLGLVVISTDSVREILRSAGFNFAKAREIAVQADNHFHSLGYGIAVDANSGSKLGIEITKNVRREQQVPVVWIHVDTPEAVVLERLRARKKDWLFRDGDHAVSEYYRNKELNKDMLKEKLPFLYTFDTSRTDIDAQIEEAAQIIEKAVSGNAVPPWPND